MHALVGASEYHAHAHANNVSATGAGAGGLGRAVAGMLRQLASGEHRGVRGLGSSFLFI